MDPSEPRPGRPASGRLDERLGRQARERAPSTRARTLAWAALGLVLLGFLVAQVFFGARPPWIGRFERDARERREKERRESEDRRESQDREDRERAESTGGTPAPGQGTTR